MTLFIDAVSWALLIAGGVFLVVGGIGLLRMPDLYTRLHAAGVADTLGASLILFGLMCQAGLTLVTVKLAIVWVFLLVTSPTASHALAKAALSDGQVPWTRSDHVGNATTGAAAGRSKGQSPSPR